MSTFSYELFLEHEFPNSNNTDNIYLDHAGATLPSKTQLQSVFDELNNTEFSNPHSKSKLSQNTDDEIEKARLLVLSHFNASPEEYDGFIRHVYHA